jgi:DNA-binding response OmpR family regulator
MKTILCIDDDQDILDTFNIILSDEGYNVVTSNSAEGIFDLIQQNKPSLILLDINLGEHNGLKICRALQSEPNTRDIPVIIVSSDSTIDQAINEYGATDILLKPFTVKELTDTADYYLAAQVIPMYQNNID